jgi:hypothetical protein
MMVDGETLRALLAAFNLRSLGTGVHPIRDERGERAESLDVDALWLARIAPSHDPEAYLMAVYARGHEPRAVFCAYCWDGLPLIKKAPIEFPASADKVVASLKQVDLFPKNPCYSLDGIRYSLYAATSEFGAEIKFANPGTESWRAVEKAMLEFGEFVARMMENADMMDYVEMWRGYVESGS